MRRLLEADGQQLLVVSRWLRAQNPIGAGDKAGLDVSAPCPSGAPSAGGGGMVGVVKPLKESGFLVVDEKLGNNDSPEVTTLPAVCPGTGNLTSLNTCLCQMDLYGLLHSLQ